MIKRFLPLLIAGAITAFPAVTYADTPNVSSGVTMTLLGAALGNNYSSESLNEVMNSGSVQTIGSNDTNFSSGLTDKWITSMLEDVNGQFAGFDTSKFVTFNTDSSGLLNAKYQLTLNSLAENGWGQIPKDGVFSNANDFKGYTFTADSGASNAAELFGKEYSSILTSMNDGTFMQSLDAFRQDMSIEKAKENVGFYNLQSTGLDLMNSMNNMSQMTSMINSFTNTMNQESNNYFNSNLYNAAATGLGSVDVSSGLREFANTPTTISASILASNLNSLKGSIDSNTVSNFSSIASNFKDAATSTKALNGIADRKNGVADISSVAQAGFKNAQTYVQNNSEFRNSVLNVEKIANNADNSMGLMQHVFSSGLENALDLFGLGEMFHDFVLGDNTNGVMGTYDALKGNTERIDLKQQTCG